MKVDHTPGFLIWHVPHDGREFPEELLSSVCIPMEEFKTYHEKMRDAGVARLIPEVHVFQAETVCFKVSRLLCDVERFIGPEEVMERYGMGFCYEKAYDGTVIKVISEELKEKTLRYYTEHHEKLDRLCSIHPKVLVFDMHSYSDDIVPADQLEEGRAMPDVCIGTDSLFTPAELYSVVKTRFEEAGFTTAENYPYRGCLVPNSAMAGRSGCVSIMLEFNKREYLDENGEVDEKKVGVIREIMQRIIGDSIRFRI